MPGGPYPNQSGAVTTHVTPYGTSADRFDIIVNGVTQRVLVPWTAGPGTPSVWCLHGLGDDHTMVTDGLFGDNGMTDAFLDDGWIVIGTGTNPQKNWGNQAGREQHALVWAWLRSVFAATPGPCLYGISMGGMMSLNYAMETVIQGLPLSAIALNSPVTDLEYGYSNIQPSSVQAAYGLASSGEGPGTSGWTTKTAGHDPERVAMSAFPVVPIRAYWSSTDSVAGANNNVLQFDDRLTAAGWSQEHVMVSVVGGHAGGDAISAYCGPWAAGTTYTAGQSVSYLGVDYIASGTTTGAVPTAGAPWTALAGSFRPADTIAFFRRHVLGSPFDEGRQYAPGVYSWEPVTRFVMDNAGDWQEITWHPTATGAAFTESPYPEFA